MTKRFIIGFGIGLFIFIAINLLSAHFTSDCGLLAVFERDACADDIARAGWPIAFYERGGFDYRFRFEPPILFIDLAMGVAFASGLGWLMTRKETKIQS